MKAHSFVLQASDIERKAFILYFYEGCSIKETAKLLGIDEAYICGYLERTITAIQNNFLSKYISK